MKEGRKEGKEGGREGERLVMPSFLPGGSILTSAYEFSPWIRQMLGLAIIFFYPYHSASAQSHILLPNRADAMKQDEIHLGQLWALEKFNSVFDIQRKYCKYPMHLGKQIALLISNPSSRIY